jgi:BirA family biotin operon repressor/biotin-[acetyl-CoA-carboxylase] ligase
MQLDPTASAAGARLTTHDTIGSTNAEALRLAREGERGPWIVAKPRPRARPPRPDLGVGAGQSLCELLLTDPAPPSVSRAVVRRGARLHDAMAGASRVRRASF